MAKTKRTEVSVQNTLLLAVDFISEIAKDKGTIQQTNCLYHNGYLIHTNGKTTMGYPVADLPPFAPHTLQLLAALRQCKNSEMSMTVLEGKVIINSGPFSATIECAPDMPTIEPDSPLVPLGPEFIKALELVSPFSVEGAKKVVLASVMAKNGCLCSSDSIVIIQAYHGCNLPEMVLPKSFVAAILNTDKKIAQFGYSGTSCTVWFEDDSWIKAQLYAESWPDIDKILNVNSNPQPLPEGFYKALDSIKSFSKTGNVYFEDGKLCSSREPSEASSYELVGIQKGPCFNIKELKRIESLINTIDFYSHNAAYFFGANLRGAIMGVRG